MVGLGENSLHLTHTESGHLIPGSNGGGTSQVGSSSFANGMGYVFVIYRPVGS